MFVFVVVLWCECVGSLNCAAFVSGIIEAFLNGTEFVSCLDDYITVEAVLTATLIWQVTLYMPASRTSPKSPSTNTILVHHQPL